jgi:hypothetical protein
MLARKNEAESNRRPSMFAEREPESQQRQGLPRVQAQKSPDCRGIIGK